MNEQLNNRVRLLERIIFKQEEHHEGFVMNNEQLNDRVKRLEGLIFKQREYLFQVIAPLEFRGDIHYFEIDEETLRINEDVVINLSECKTIKEMFLKIKEVNNKYSVFLHKEHYEVSVKKLPKVIFRSEWSVPSFELVMKL